jgi:hypothetical protein
VIKSLLLCSLIRARRHRALIRYICQYVLSMLFRSLFFNKSLNSSLFDFCLLILSNLSASRNVSDVTPSFYSTFRYYCRITTFYTLIPRRFVGGRMLSDLNNFYRIRSVFYKRCRFPMKSDTNSIENDRIYRSHWISWVARHSKECGCRGVVILQLYPYQSLLV